MNKLIFLILLLFSQIFALYCDNYFFECSIDGNCSLFYYSGCLEEWKNDSVIIRSLSMDVLLKMEESPLDIPIGLRTDVLDVNLHQGDSVYLEFYSNYGSWIRKVKVEDPYTRETQFLPDED